MNLRRIKANIIAIFMFPMFMLLITLFPILKTLFVDLRQVLIKILVNIFYRSNRVCHKFLKVQIIKLSGIMLLSNRLWQPFT